MVKVNTKQVEYLARNIEESEIAILVLKHADTPDGEGYAVVNFPGMPRASVVKHLLHAGLVMCEEENPTKTLSLWRELEELDGEEEEEKDSKSSGKKKDRPNKGIGQRSQR